MNKKPKTSEKDMLFVPFSQDDFLPGNYGAEYLNEVIWRLIEMANEQNNKPTPSPRVIRNKMKETRAERQNRYATLIIAFFFIVFVIVAILVDKGILK